MVRYERQLMNYQFRKLSFASFTLVSYMERSNLCWERNQIFLTRPLLWFGKASYAQAIRNFYVFSYATRARRCQLQIAGSMVPFLPLLEWGKVRRNPPSPEHVSQVLYVKLKCLQINCNISKSALQQNVRQAAFSVVDSPSKPYSYLTSTITSSEKINIL